MSIVVERDINQLARRVRSEYLEMPGLSLTVAQARRLWHLDRSTCETVLSTLVEKRFLKRSRSGQYLRVRHQ